MYNNKKAYTFLRKVGAIHEELRTHIRAKDVLAFNALLPRHTRLVCGDYALAVFDAMKQRGEGIPNKLTTEEIDEAFRMRHPEKETNV